MQFFAEKGLVGDISDVWKNITGMSDALKKASTGADGKQYFVPITNYPWAVFYRKSVFKDKGYEVPKTLDELNALGAQMKKDGLAPIAFGDKDGWPAMGTFDQINLRVNGYDFHVSLMAGKEAWTDPKVKKVFDTWAGILPLHQADSLGRTWQEAAQSLAAEEVRHVRPRLVRRPAVQEGRRAGRPRLLRLPGDRLTIGTDAVEAPIDGYMMRQGRRTRPAPRSCSSTSPSRRRRLCLKADPSVIATNSKADTSGYTALQKKSVELVKSAKSITQFMDRDTRPDFASTVMIPAIQDFIKNPTDIDGLSNKIESQKKSIFGS